MKKTKVEAVVKVNGETQERVMKGNGLVILSFDEEVREDAVRVEGGVVGRISHRAVADGFVDIMERFEDGREMLLFTLIERMFLGGSQLEREEEENISSELDAFLDQILKRSR